MNLVVTDTCIFIDLWNIGLLHDFFSLELHIHTTYSVIKELDADQNDVLRLKQADGRLMVHELTHEQRLVISTIGYPKSLSEVDKSVLYLASELKAMVLSSDKVVRNCAKRLNLEFHGILWIIENLVNEKKISPQMGNESLLLLLETNSMMQGSREVLTKVAQLHILWSD